MIRLLLILMWISGFLIGWILRGIMIRNDMASELFKNNNKSVKKWIQEKWFGRKT